jgi:predicted transposase YdaD
MDHDRLFKELLRIFFFEFIALFLPDLAAYVDRDSIEFLDKEIFTDIASSERHEVDLIAKARFRGLGERFFLIHLEDQAGPQADFPFRMFGYFGLLHRKFRLPVYPVALFTYDQPMRPEPEYYEVEFPDFSVLRFNFRVIQLNRLNWRDYLRNPNPVAAALMTKMRIAPEDRPRVKLECLRMLATLKLDRARATLITTFMDSYLKLTTAEAIAYNRQLETIEPKEREEVMQLTNEWIEQGKIEGKIQGKIEGDLSGRRALVLRLLRHRLGEVPPETAEEIERLGGPQVDELGEAIFDFHDVNDVRSWLVARR